MSKFKRPGAKPAQAPAPQATPAAAPRSRYRPAAAVQLGVESTYMRPGDYLLMIERIETGVTEQKREPFISVKLKVLAASDDGLSALDRQFGRGIHTVGETVSWFSKESGPAALYFEQNMLKFALVAWDMTQEEIAAAEQENEESFIEALKRGDGLIGVVIEGSATMRQRKKSKEDNEEPAEDNLNTFPKWKRRVPYSELAEILDEKALAMIPDLDEKLAEEAQDNAE